MCTRCRGGSGCSEQRTHNPPVVGSSPTRPTRGFTCLAPWFVERFVDRCRLSGYRYVMAPDRTGHIEQLPSGSYRVQVYAGTDPLTGREIRFRKTRKTEREAQIELGKLLAQPAMGRQPDSDVTVAQLLDQYVSDCRVGRVHAGKQSRVCPPDHQTHLRVHASPQGRRPLLDTFYARPMRCGTSRAPASLSSSTAPSGISGPTRPTPARMAAGRGSCAGGDPLRSNWPQVTRCRRCPTSPGSKG